MRLIAFVLVIGATAQLSQLALLLILVLIKHCLRLLPLDGGFLGFLEIARHIGRSIDQLEYESARLALDDLVPLDVDELERVIKRHITAFAGEG